MSSRAADLDAAWRKTRPVLDKILYHFEDGLLYKEHMEAYTAVLNFCTKTQSVSDKPDASSGARFGGQELYEQLRSYLTEHVLRVKQETVGLMDENLLAHYLKSWRSYERAGKIISHIFDYMNRNWIKRQKDEKKRDVYNVFPLAMVVWRTHFFLELKSTLTSCLLSLITRDRDGESVNMSLIKGIVDSYVALGIDDSEVLRSSLEVYEEHFQKPFIEATRQYFRAESSKFIMSHTVSEFLKKVEQRIEEEERRVQLYLHDSTKPLLVRVCEEELLSSHHEVISEEFKRLLADDKEGDLARVFTLMSRLPAGLDPLRRHLEAHVKAAGLSAIESIAENVEADPKQYVDTLLEVHRKYSELVQRAFRGEAGFVAALDKACREIVNRNAVCAKSTSKSPELLARFCDSVLKKSAKHPEESELEDTLRNVMVVFKYIEDKDVFQTFFSRMLARRLISGTSVSEDAEESMISKLKEACGFEYTAKLHRMFNDMQTSRDLNAEFQQSLEKRLDVDVTVLVLGTSSWPLTAPSTPLVIPDELESSVSAFQRFYQDKHSGRKLTWLFQLSKGELKANYCHGTRVGYTFQVSTYQMSLLLLYNNADEYTYEELLNSVKLSEDILKQVLAIIVKAKVLLCDEEVGAPGSRYRLNFDLKSKKFKINLNMPLKMEQRAEQEETHKHVQEDRKLLIQAAIVRIMKTRKQLKHMALVNEVITQLQTRFNPSVADIKKCIDILIEKDYIMRAEGQKDVFVYVA